MIFVSSDWHGCDPAKIQRLLTLADFSEEDSLFVLGDVIDRGAHGVALLKWLMLQPNAYLLRGNHEAMLLDAEWLFQPVTDETTDRISDENIRALSLWEMNGAEPTISALSEESPEDREEILEYLRDCPFYDTVSVGDRDFLLVHAGLGEYDVGKRISDYTEHDLLWSRPSLDTHYSKNFITVIGHTPTHFYGSSNRGRMLKTPTWWNVDTGAAAGLSPMLLCLDDGREFYLS